MWRTIAKDACGFGGVDGVGGFATTIRTALRWRGLLADEGRKQRLVAFGALAILSASMAFLQLGFVRVLGGACYAMTLLGITTVAALLLGGLAAGAEGLIAGGFQCVHAFLQPLDPMERYLLTPLNSIGLYVLMGLVAGFLFGVVLAGHPRGTRRWASFVAVCLALGFIGAVLFTSWLTLDSVEAVLAYIDAGTPSLQMLWNAALMLTLSLMTDLAVDKYHESRHYISLRTIVQTRLVAALFLAFMVVSAVGFAAITVHERLTAYDHMASELEYLQDRYAERQRLIEEIEGYKEIRELPHEALATVTDGLSLERFIGGYDLDDGTILLVKDDRVVLSDNPSYGVGDNYSVGLGEEEPGRLHELAQSGEVLQVLYPSGTESLELGYLKVAELEPDAHLVMSLPFSMVFAGRSEAMLWMTLLVLVLLSMMYVLVARLLKDTVIDPIDGANASLSKIMAGNLDVVVSEVDSAEFASLSAGVNSTVEALKDLIGEAKMRIERELATARAIQEGSLPKGLPAFAHGDMVSLFAIMDAAREVGGDFYDYFEVDDHTVGIVVADVSGKGIPAALFMMAAKSEISNRLASGMEPVEAIRAANEGLCANNEAGMFVTVWAATLDWKTGLLTFVNAGHNYPLLRHGRGGSWEWVRTRGGLFLGSFDTAPYRQATLTLEPGDELVIYTDGVNEAFSASDEEYGNQRLETYLEAHADLSPKELVRGLRADVVAWAEGADQSDDVTIMAVEYGVRR